jgi:hypothetical protein
MDVDGDKVGDLDPDSVYYTGISLGGMYGAPFLAVEPDVSAGALIVLGGPTIERFRFGGVNRAGAGLLGQTAGTVVTTHGLLNAPGITSLDGLNVPAPYFDENMPLRDGVPLDVKLADGTTRTIVSPVTNGVAGAIAIQEVFDNWEWVSLGGDPVAYAPYLRKDPLPGVDTAKSVLVQFAKGDVYAPNPTTTAFLRAGDLADQATYYRYDLTPVYYQDPNLRAPLGYPHTFAALTTSTNATIQGIALAAQRQIAAFFASGGAQTIQPPGVPAEYFEVGMDETELPEGLNYTVAAPPPASTASSTAGDAYDAAFATYGRAHTRGQETNAQQVVNPQSARSLPAAAGNPKSRLVRLGSPGLLQAVVRDDLLLVAHSPAVDGDGTDGETASRLADRAKESARSAVGVRDHVFELLADHWTQESAGFALTSVSKMSW